MNSTPVKSNIRPMQYIMDFLSSTSTGEDLARYVERDITTCCVPAVTSIGSNAFYGCSSLTTVDFPAATSIEDDAFAYCSSLATVDFPAVTSISDTAFRECSSLTTVILRNTKTVCRIYNCNYAFAGTPIASGTGYIYVPSAFIESYKTDRYWSRYASRFRALEEYTVDGTVTGELDQTKI